MTTSLALRGSSALFSFCKFSAVSTKSAVNSARLIVPSSAASRHSLSRTSFLFQSPSELENDGSEVTPPASGVKAGASPAISNIQDVSKLQRLEKCLNKCTLMGRIGSEPQLRGTEQHPVLLFSLATHVQYRDESGNMQQKTFWHRVAIFKSGLRETAFKFCRKGSRVYLTGEIQYNNVVDPETNVTRIVTSIVADDLIMLGPSPTSVPATTI